MQNYKSKFTEASEEAYDLTIDIANLSASLENADLFDASKEEKEKLKTKLSELKELIHYVETYRL